MSFNAKNIKISKTGFEYKCLFILIEGYRLMKKAGEYSLNWEEEQITAQLIFFIEKSTTRTTLKIHVKPEIRIYKNEIITGEKSPKKANRIDMQMLSWQNEHENIYHIEAKNLCEKDWIKENGSKVRSSELLNRYVNTGIKHFFSGHYPLNGCLCGYLLQGDNNIIIDKLNNILYKKSLDRLQIDKTINNHPMIYKIIHKNDELINIFFDYQ